VHTARRLQASGSMTGGIDTRLVRALLFLVLSSVVPGCFPEDECGGVDDEMCIGGLRYSCSYRSGAYRLHDTGQSCSVFAASGQAASSQPLPRCGEDEPSHCDGEVSADCTPGSGFADCGRSGKECGVSDGGYGYCW
jgi:hypothetical protein